MKDLFLVFLFSLCATACNADPVPTPTVSAVTEAPVEKAPEVKSKKVCIKVWDAKLNKEVEKCRTMKIHQKHEGTNVPTK